MSPWCMFSDQALTLLTHLVVEATEAEGIHLLTSSSIRV